MWRRCGPRPKPRPGLSSSVRAAGSAACAGSTAAPAAPPARLVPARQEITYVEPEEAEVVEAELAEIGDRVGRQVAQDMRGTEDIAAHTRQLGEEVDQADDKLEARLHEVFDHQLGRLKKSATDHAAQSASASAAADRLSGFTAGSIADLLLKSENVRNAIILGEILKRPDERW